MPTPFQTPTRKPWRTPEEMLEKTPGPGVTERMIVAMKYVSQADSSINVPFRWPSSPCGR